MEILRIFQYKKWFLCFTYVPPHWNECTTLSVSSGKAERGFLVLKSLKPSKQAVPTNRHLQRQMLINIDGPEIERFKPNESINYWYKRSTSKHSDGKACAKQPAHWNTPNENLLPKPKQTKSNFVAIRLHDIFVKT